MSDKIQSVRAWNEKVIIPTYGIGEPEKNPVFLDKRVYQGSSGAVYPYPVIEKILDDKEDKEWNAIYLENQYLKIMILPELGGRIHMAYDKLKNRHFVYYNRVIKPALVGLTGPWISGGIEFNWPQHHRPTTFDPLDSLIEKNTDGSITVWCSELERMSRTKGMAGFTLHPGKAYLEIRVKLFNPTPHPQTFLWWANPAVKVNDDYQSVFPPDVNAVYDHGKRDVSSFPIATGTYYKVDYSAGVDISRYKNIPVPTSYMAITSRYDFVGAYENDNHAGLLHVADHHLSPGKKQWTWGNGEFGQAWDRNLTDEDGPYIELMCGVYTDNQPDFSWLQPFEEKSFTQYFMPYRDLGMVKNATKEAMLNLDSIDDKIRIRVFTTGEYPSATIRLERDNNILFEKTTDLHPGMSFEQILEGGSNTENTYLCVSDSQGIVLVDWHSEPGGEKEIPEPAKPAREPKDLPSTEQLYLQGLHLEQYRHATYSPLDYYREALRRDPGDIRNNNAMGLWLLRRGQFRQAEPYFRRAVETLCERNPNPADGEALFNLGHCLFMQDRREEAYTAFFKSTWNAAWQDSGFFHAALIDSSRGDYDKALELCERSMIKNWTNTKTRHLMIAVLRKKGQLEKALKLAEDSLQMDRFSFAIIFEKYLILDDHAILNELKELIRDNVHNYIEASLDYVRAGFYEEAIHLIDIHLNGKDEAYPMAWYFRGWYLNLAGRPEEAEKAFGTAERMPADYCFPNKTEELLALQEAVKINPDDSKAWYYMGNYWYGAHQYTDALECWESSYEMNRRFPTVNRNLALIYYNKENKPWAARIFMEKAFRLDPSDGRILMELDQLYKKMGISAEERLRQLETFSKLVESRDDLYLEMATLYNMTGMEEKALGMIMSRKFHPWEGGEGKVTGQYVTSHVQLAKKAIIEHNYENALEHLRKAKIYPHNLGEGKLFGTRENDIDYWMGCAYEGMGENTRAHSAWEDASKGDSEPAMALYYNDQQPDKIYYQGLALQKMGHHDEAVSIFSKLISHGEEQLKAAFRMDYFAVSLPDLLIFEENLQEKHEMNCHHLIGLGYLGLGNKKEAHARFKLIQQSINLSIL